MTYDTSTTYVSTQLLSHGTVMTYDTSMTYDTTQLLSHETVMTYDTILSHSPSGVRPVVELTPVGRPHLLLVC